MQPVALKLRRGGINWKPPFPEGEDELSLKRHRVAAEWVHAKNAWSEESGRAHESYLPRQTEANEQECAPNRSESRIPCFIWFQTGIMFFFLIKFLLLIRECHTEPVAREFPLPRLLWAFIPDYFHKREREQK